MAKIHGDRWKTVKTLGEGGQAYTFLVTDIRGENETPYVLKRLKNIKRIERFKSEIEAVRNLSHENIVRLIDFDLEAEKPYLVTEYCSGGSLSEAEPFWHESLIKALEVFQQICKGVAYAHSQDIIHRDLKPDNIFLRTKDGPAVVGDFGICWVEKDGTRITLPEEAVGPRLFMAPELEDGRVDDISPKSDTYSLGKLLYWLLSGKVFSREKHREPEWDLKGQKRWTGRKATEEHWDNIYMEHVNRLLDRMIAVNPGERLDVGKVLQLSWDVMRLVQKEFTPIAKGIQQPCTYCGYGYYELRAVSDTSIRNFGFNLVGSPIWRVFVCNECGHVQLFRLEGANRKDWWGLGS